jgi:hypothetical protein
METLGNQKNEKNENIKQPKYCCECCDFITCKLTDYSRHLLTQKHIRNQKNEKNEKNETKLYVCENCNKEYCDKSGLWKHRKNCHSKDKHEKECGEEGEELDISTKQLILMLFKQNNELQQSLIEMSKQTTSNINNNANNSYNNNKTFNLQVFLNETCKDAMNIKDFVDSVQLELSDLEKVGKSGYIEGISSIIIKNLNALEMEKRPIHCTDNKREVIYIKDEDKWEKEEDNKPKLKKLIKAIAHKNICMFKKFREKYPDCDNGESKKSSVFNTIVYESMGGKGDDEAVKDNKIIHKISKHVGIDKVHLTTF